MSTAEVYYGRARQTGVTNLLDQDELNLGSTQEVIRPNASNTVQPGTPVRLLDLQCDGKRGRVATVVMTASITQPELPDQFADVSGPLTGIVEFGSGAAFARVEFDIQQMSRLPSEVQWNGVNPHAQWPNLPLDPNIGPEAYPRELLSPRTSGVSLTVPSSSLRVYARNDNNMRWLWPQVPYKPGDGGVVGFVPWPTIGQISASDLIDPIVSAHVAYEGTYGSNNGRLKKTVWINPPPLYFFSNNVSYYYNGVNPGDAVTRIGIPPFAKTVRFPRMLRFGMTSFLVEFVRNVGSSSAFFSDAVINEYQISTVSDGPVEVPPNASFLSIYNNGPNPIYGLSAVFELTI